MTNKPLNQKELSILYRECLNHPSLLDELDPYQIEKIHIKNEAEKNNKMDRIFELINSNPEYNYPAEYLPDKLIDYWMDRQKSTWDKLNRLDAKIKKRENPILPTEKRKTKPESIKARNKPFPNKKGRENILKGLKNSPIKTEVIKTAKSIVSESNKPRDYYINENNNARTHLWKHAKIQKINKGNSRGWIDQAIKDGFI